jgi:endonuclease YncB( thermonuclease family)
VRNVFGGVRSRSRARGQGLGIAAIALLALVGVGGSAFLGRTRSSPEAVAEGPAATGAVREAQATAAEPARPLLSRARALRGVPEVIDTATLSLQGEVIRLFGVEWAPGGGKPEDLARYLQGRETVCDPMGANEVYRCQVGGQDLSRVVLFNGGGKPTSEATPDLKAAADKAREGRLGVWKE